MKLTFFTSIVMLACLSLFKIKDAPDFAIYIPSYVPLSNSFDFTNIDSNRFELGKELFYDPILSKNNMISCSSCHNPNNAFADTNRFSSGIHGRIGRRNSMSLINLAWGTRFFWDGSAPSLDSLIIIPITDTTEMGLTIENLRKKINLSSNYKMKFKKYYNLNFITEKDVALSISYFVKSIVSFSSKMDVFLNGNFDKIDSTKDKEFYSFLQNHLYNDKISKIVQVCSSCHGGFRYGGEKFKNNGVQDLHDEGYKSVTKLDKDRGVFKVPTLRNVAMTPPYMHNGRFNSLDEVIDHYANLPYSNQPNLSHELKDNLAILKTIGEVEKKHLIQMLDYMTDYSLINSKIYRHNNY